MTSIVKFDRRHDTIAKIEQWQLKQSTVQDQDDHVTALPNQGHVSRLCQFLLDLFREIMVLLRKENKTSSAIEMDLERSRSAIVLWSDGYGIAQGDFDETFEKANRLRRAVVGALSHIGALLTERLIPQAEIWSDQLQGLCLRVRTALEDAGRLIGDGVGSDSDSDSDESSSGDSVRSSGDDMAEIAEDLRTDTCCLAGLGPLLKNPVYDMPAEAEPQTLLACTWHPTQHYSDKIQSRFPQADKDLVNRLGKANYERYLRCQAVRDDGHQNEGSVAGEYTSSYAAPTLVVGSKFHSDSGIGSSIAPTVVSYAETVMSYRHEGRSVRIPPLPEGAKDGRPFECVACGRMVVMRNISAWKRHIYLDLQPYTCIDVQCPYNGAPFPSREQWVSHLALDHDMGPDWRSIDCSLCLQETGEGKMPVVQHLSRHLEEISLSALPACVDSNTTSELDSENDGPEDILPARNAAREDPIKTQDSDSSLHDQPGDMNHVPQAAALGKEQLQHMPVMPTLCRDCNFYAWEGPDQRNKLLQHYNSEEHRMNTLQRYRCETCGRRFLARDYLLQHEEKCRQDRDASPISEDALRHNRIKCSVCKIYMDGRNAVFCRKCNTRQHFFCCHPRFKKSLSVLSHRVTVHCTQCVRTSELKARGRSTQSPEESRPIVQEPGALNPATLGDASWSQGGAAFRCCCGIMHRNRDLHILHVTGCSRPEVTNYLCLCGRESGDADDHTKHFQDGSCERLRNTTVARLAKLDPDHTPPPGFDTLPSPSIISGAASDKETKSVANSHPEIGNREHGQEPEGYNFSKMLDQEHHHAVGDQFMAKTGAESATERQDMVGGEDKDSLGHKTTYGRDSIPGNVPNYLLEPNSQGMGAGGLSHQGSNEEPVNSTLHLGADPPFSTRELGELVIFQNGDSGYVPRDFLSLQVPRVEGSASMNARKRRQSKRQKVLDQYGVDDPYDLQGSLKSKVPDSPKCETEVATAEGVYSRESSQETVPDPGLRE